MSKNNAQKLVIKHLSRAPRYAFRKAYAEADNHDERERVKTIATACGVPLSEFEADILARKENITLNAPLERLTAIFSALDETEKEIYITHLLNEYHKQKNN